MPGAPEPTTTDAAHGGRFNQRARTRRAIVDAARSLIESGGLVTMALIADRALVSEATAYRYFNDLPAVIAEALTGLWPTPEEALMPVAGSRDPGERIACAAQALLRRVLTYEGSTRAMIAATIARPGSADARPGYRLGYIDEAVDPIVDTLHADAEAVADVKRQLGMVISPESLFTLMDLYRLSPERAIEMIVRTARNLIESIT
jgi:AcrR family transcriptional regulator